MNEEYVDQWLRDAAYYQRVLLENLPSILAYWDRDLRCRYANRAYERWFGVDSASLIGMSLLDLLGPELFALNEPHIRAVLRGKEQSFERIVPGPGGIRHGLATYIPDIVDGEVVGVVVQVTEVTRLKETEAALQAQVGALLAAQEATQTLQRNERKLRELFMQASDGIFIADLEGRYVGFCCDSGIRPSETGNLSRIKKPASRTARLRTRLDLCARRAGPS